MKKQSRFNSSNSKYIFEQLEERQLFSGGIEGIILAETESPVASYLHAEVETQTSGSVDDADLVSAAETQTREIVFVDTGVEGYQTLLNDLQNNADRNIEVVLLDNNRNGIEQISEVLGGYQNLDAVHIIAHGEDGSLNLGNTNLNQTTLNENQPGIVSWADSFSGSGDILIYGCNLAETDIGKNLINTLSELTLTDVAASDDLTGHESLGGDWELEYSAGDVETDIVVGSNAQTQFKNVLATMVLESFEPGNAEMADQVNEIKPGIPAGQTFSYNSPNATYEVNQVEIVLYQAVDAPAGQTITVTLRDSFDGSILGSATMSSDDLTTTETWYSFDIGSATLNDNQTYTIQVENDGLEKVYLGVDQTGTYTNGDLLDKDGIAQSGKDAAFKIIQTTTPFAHWTFDSDATDSSGNNYDGVLTNGAQIDTNAGTNQIGDGKLNLDGNNDYVDFSAHAANFQGLTEGTISVWVYHNVNDRDVIFELSDSGDADSRLALFRDTDGSFDFYIREGSTTLLDVSTAAGVIPLNTWTNIAVTVDSGGNKLYVNGVEQTTGLTYAVGSSTTNAFFDDVPDLDFASWGVDRYDGSSFTRYFDGFLDDGRVYDHALSAADIAELASLANVGQTVSFQQGVNGYTGTQDTFVDELNPAQNNGNDVTIDVDLNDGANDTASGLIRFDNLFGSGPGQIPFGATINSASLTVNVTNLSGATTQITMHQMLIDWNESSTWNSTGNGVQTDNVEAATAVASLLEDPDMTGAQTFSGLESSLQAWSDGSANYGWVIQTDNTNGWDFDSSESVTAGDRPQLTISYTLANLAPTTSNNTVSADEDVPYVFTAADFQFSDADTGDTLQQIQITSLETVGDLTLNGVAVTLGQIITRAEIDAGDLTFTALPNESGSGYDSFEFRVHDGTEYSAATGSVSIINASFDSDAGGFTYADITNGSFADGSYDATGGATGGGIRIDLGGDITGGETEGGWSQTFNLTEATDITVSTDFQLIISSEYESDEYGELFLAIDGVNYGNDIGSSLIRTVGDGNGGVADNSGWLSFETTITLAAGNHTLLLSAVNNISTAPDEFIEAYFDNVSVTSPIYNTMTVDVDPIDDAGSFAGDLSATTDEDTATSGTATFSDSADGFTTPNFSINSAATNGTAAINAAGDWTYTPDLNYNGADSFTVQVTDDDGNVETQVISLSVTPVSDAGSFAGDLSATTDEDTATSGTATFSDSADGFTTPNFSINSAATNGTAAINAAGDWTYTPDLNYNGADSFTVQVTDDDGNVETQVISIAVTPVSDAGSFAGDLSATTDEDTAISGTATFSDAIDGFTTPNFSLTTTASNGTGAIDAAGNWSYTPTANYNGADSFTVQVTDDDGNVETQVISITVTAVNDTAIIAGADTGSVTDDVDPDADTLLEASGTLTIADDDAGESSFQAGTVTGTYGDLVIDATGNWSYSADNTQAAIQQLDDGESMTDTLTVLAFDGTPHNVVITINGSDDAAIIGGTITGSVTENNTLTSSGNLSIIDIDSSDNIVSFNNVVTTSSDNGYGTFELTGNVWTYTLDNNHSSVQSLGLGETLSDTITFIASDNSTQQVVVTINGRHDEVVLPPLTPSGITPDELTLPTNNPGEDSASENDQAIENPPLPDQNLNSGNNTEDPLFSNLNISVKPLVDNIGNPEAAASPFKPVLATSENTDPSKTKQAEKEIINAALKTHLLDKPSLNQPELDLWIDTETEVDEEEKRVLWQQIDKLQQDINGDVADNGAQEVEVKIVLGSAATLSVGFITWVLRGGALLASLMSAVPVLNRFDPLPILKSKSLSKDDPDDITESNDDTKSRLVNELFSREQRKEE